MNALFYALDKNEFNRISTCETTFDIWRTLEITHEGTSRVKDSKVNILLHDFKLFRMQPSKTIGDMYTRFMDVVNNLRVLGKSFSNFDLISKILRSLPKRWDPKITAIQETKDLNIFLLEELIGSLMTYEMVHNTHDEHDEQNNLPKNRKDLEPWTNEYHLSDDSSDEDNDELELRTLNLNNFIKQKSKINNELERRKRRKKRNATKDESKTFKGETTNWALTSFDYKVSNSTLLNYFEIT